MAKVAALVVRDALSEWNRVDSSMYGTDVSGRSMTKQSFRDECDINNIVKQFTETGVFPEAALPPQFGDVTGLDFREMMDRVNEANASFAALPAHVRKRFGNSAQEFVEFCSDEANAEEMVRLGLREAPEAPEAKGVGVPPKDAAKAAPGASGEDVGGVSEPKGKK